MREIEKDKIAHDTTVRMKEMESKSNPIFLTGNDNGSIYKPQVQLANYEYI